MEEQNNEQQLTKKERRQARRQEKMQNMQRARQGKGAKRFGFWLFIIVLLVGAGYGVVKLAGSATHQTQSFLTDEVSVTDHVKGNPEAQTILVEYSDFQCPACGAYSPITAALTEEFNQDLRFVYRHFPLSSIHPNATPAAVAAEAAGAQGKFWEMHDMLFENQTSWSGLSSSEDAFIAYAEALGLNIDQFKNDLSSNELESRVQNQYSSGIRSQVNSTPTFFLNGEKIQNPRSLDDFRVLIENSVNETKKVEVDNL